MLRKILGAIAGYIVLFIVIFATFSVAYLVMGANAAFTTGSYDVTMTWIIISFILGFIAAVVGGYAASVVGKSWGAVKILAGIVLVMGILTAILVAVAPKPTDGRPAGTANLEAMSKAQTPLWVCIINPLIGIAGVLVGGSLKKNIGDRAAVDLQ